jgi:hypothetical protein
MRAHHAQVYGAIFITAGVGAFLLSRHVPREKLVWLGLIKLWAAAAQPSG